MGTRSRISLPSAAQYTRHGHKILNLVTIGSSILLPWAQDPESRYHQLLNIPVMGTRFRKRAQDTRSSFSLPSAAQYSCHGHKIADLVTISSPILPPRAQGPESRYHRQPIQLFFHLHNSGNTLPAANTKGSQTVTGSAAFHFIEQSNKYPRTAGTNGVSKRNRAAVYI